MTCRRSEWCWRPRACSARWTRRWPCSRAGRRGSWYTRRMRVGFVGAGMIARCHAFAMNALPYYYEDAPEIVPALVTSARPERARRFAKRFAFERAVSEAEL